ncbi:MAG: DUF4328 domain-containing protein [Nitrososphaera sp.]
MSTDPGNRPPEAFTPLEGLAKKLSILFILEAVLGFVAVFFTQVTFIPSIIALVALVAFLLWFYRANRNLRALGGTGLRFTPGWAVVWWFVPIANFWMPYKAAVEMAKAGDPSVGATDREIRSQLKAPRLILIWWVFSIASLAALILVAAAAVIWSASDADAFASGENMPFELAGAGLTAANLWLTILVIREITMRQTLKIQAFRSAGTA